MPLLACRPPPQAAHFRRLRALAGALAARAASTTHDVGAVKQAWRDTLAAGNARVARFLDALE
jgi:hypothetical protein